jgi:hypothetical protein
MAEKISKKESRQRGYMTLDEVMKHLEGKDPGQQRHYLERALGYKGKLIAPETKNHMYKILTDIYLKKGRILEASRYYAHQNLAGGEHLITPQSMHLQAEFLDQQGYHEEAQRIRDSEEEIHKYEQRREQRKVDTTLSDLERELNVELYRKATLKKEIIAPAVAVLGGLFCLSPNLTGNVIGNSSLSSSNVLGIALLLVGIVGAFIIVRKRK